MKRLLLLFTVCISSVSYGQFNCADTTFVELTSFNSSSIVDITSPILFTDSGGENGNYSSNENYEIIFDSGSSTNTIVVNLNETDFEHGSSTAWDYLKIYTSTDGVNWILYEDPNFFVPGYSIVPDNIGNGILPFTLDLGTQYIKFTFYSDSSINESGWKIILTPQNSSTSPGSETMTECNSYTWNANGQTYTQSGQYTTILTNAQGCDSTVTLDLTITQPNTGSETVTECDTYTWATNGQTYTQTGQYTEVLPNQNGCDSTVTLNLTITNSNTGSETVTECDSYTWSTNGQTYTQSGQYTEVLSNQSGCDSTVTLNLTIETVDITTQPVDQNVVVGNNAQFTVVTTAFNLTYQWQMNDGTGWTDLFNAGQYSGTDTDVLTISNVQLNQNNFMYRCVVTSGNCETISSVARLTIQDNVGLEDLTKQGFTLFPNPTRTSFTITSEKVINSNFRIMDGQGREVLTGTMNGQEHTMDISILSKGVYSVVFEQQDLPVLSVVKE